ncbi:MAG TPA: hypothetical protein VME44_09090 [Streptosporangiaceae bacterium]|nr:hypothetical protein [Streptosporangiaceae bacterium]
MRSATPVARPEREVGVGLSQTAIAQDRDRDAAWRPPDVDQKAADGRRVGAEIYLENLVSGKRGRLWRWRCTGPSRLVHGRGVPHRSICPRFSYFIGNPAEHARISDPALDLLPVAGQYGQAVPAVGFKLAQRLA